MGTDYGFFIRRNGCTDYGWVRADGEYGYGFWDAVERLPVADKGCTDYGGEYELRIVRGTAWDLRITNWSIISFVIGRLDEAYYKNSISYSPLRITD